MAYPWEEDERDASLCIDLRVHTPAMEKFHWK